MQSLSASHRLSRDKKTQQASDLFFVSLFLVLFISDNSFIMTQPNARFLVEWPPLIRPLTATSSSPGSKNQVLKRRWNEKGRERHRKLGNGATEEKKRKEKNKGYLYHATTRVLHWNKKGRKRHRNLGNGAVEEKKRIGGTGIN